MKFLFSLLLILFTQKILFGQIEINSAELLYSIQPTFKNKNEQNELVNIYKKIVLGDYKSAKKEIEYQKKQKKTKSTFFYALLNYEATIHYNESNYQKAIDLCDSVLNNLEEENSFFLKSINLKSKSKAALNDLKQSKNDLNKAIKISKKHKDNYNLSTSYYLYAAVLSDEGNYTESNNYFYQSLRIKNRIKDSIGSAACYAFLGLNYANMTNYSKGISLLHKSISIREKIKDKRGLANSYLSLYKIYFDNGEKDKALKSELKSLSICKELNDYQCISGRLTNIGELYNEKKDYKKALDYQNKALIISRKIKTQNKIAIIHQNIAKIYNNCGKLDFAKIHIDSSILLNDKIGLKDAKLSSELILADIYIKQKKFNEAMNLVSSALENAEKIKAPLLQKEAHRLASTVYEFLNKNDKSLIHYKLYIDIRDSIENIKKSKELSKKEFEFEFQKKAELFKLKQNEKLKQIEERNNLQKISTYISVIALIIVSFLFLTTLKLNKQKLQTKLNLINTNRILMNKNREILDSISYAKRIQSAILPQEKLIKSYLPNSFIFYKPKYIVAGDFYWFETTSSPSVEPTQIKRESKEKDDLIFFAAADCTGHGVPGAMVSVVCNNALNRSVKEFALKNPAEILNKTREIVIAEFEKADEDVKDGMDISLCAINLASNVLHWAGAHNPLWILRNSELIEFKADKQPIGKFAFAKDFTKHEILLQKDDEIYIFTDGFQDQFGGEKGKKYKVAQLRELLLSLNFKTMEEKRTKIEEAFENWKGELEQVDDVCFIGFKI